MFARLCVCLLVRSFVRLCCAVFLVLFDFECVSVCVCVCVCLRSLIFARLRSWLLDCSLVGWLVCSLARWLAYFLVGVLLCFTFC